MATPVQPVPVLVNRARNGKLNSDTDILELKEGNYPDRVNVEFNADGELFSDTPALGNKDVCSFANFSTKKSPELLPASSNST